MNVCPHCGGTLARTATPSEVYYLRRPDGDIKIGYSNNVPVRVRTLSRQLGYHIDLLASHPGGRDVERRLHRRFTEARRLEGEWFRPVPALLAHIEKIRATQQRREDATVKRLAVALSSALGAP